MNPLFTRLTFTPFGFIGYICRVQSCGEVLMGRPVHTTGSRRSVRRAIKRELAMSRSRGDVFPKGIPVDRRFRV